MSILSEIIAEEREEERKELLGKLKRAYESKDWELIIKIIKDVENIRYG